VLAANHTDFSDIRDPNRHRFGWDILFWISVY